MRNKKPLVPMSLTTEEALGNALNMDYYVLSVEEPLYSQIRGKTAIWEHFSPDWEPEDYAMGQFLLLKRKTGKHVYDPEKHQIRYLLLK